MSSAVMHVMKQACFRGAVIGASSIPGVLVILTNAPFTSSCAEAAGTLEGRPSWDVANILPYLLVNHRTGEVAGRRREETEQRG